MDANDALAVDERNVDVSRPTLVDKLLEQPLRAYVRYSRPVCDGLFAVCGGIDHELDKLLEALYLLVDETLARAAPAADLARVVKHPAEPPPLTPFFFFFPLLVHENKRIAEKKGEFFFSSGG